MIWPTIIDRYYPQGELRALLLQHSRSVADRALLIAHRHPEWQLDETFIEDAAMLHDVGIFRCDAPGIHCYGQAHYLMHGRLGAALLRREGYEALARVAERHTGTGLTRATMQALGLPVAPIDLVPETREERLICYADKFYSKSHLERTRTVEQTARSLEKFGAEGVAIFMRWAEEFEG